MTRIGPREALWWAQDYLYAAAAWVGSHFGKDRPYDYAGGGLRPVLMVPGVYENWRFMRPVARALHAAGHPVYVLPELGHNLAPIAEGARAVHDYLENNRLRGVAIVAHSKGGLIGKLAMTGELAEDARIALVVAICTPFGGARLARYLPWPALRPLVPGHPSLVQLTAAQAVNSRVTSIYGVFDPHIPEGSELPGATNIELPIAGHFRILGRPETARAVLAAVA